MTATTTTQPPTTDLTTTDKRLRRRRLFEQLRREGRGWGQAPFGFRWTGKRGNRRLVPDLEQRRIMTMVVELRDTEGLSFGRISDHIERHLAERERRRPRSRGFRTGWTQKTCWRAYRAMKKLEAEGEPVASHKRCRECKRSLPLAEFTPTGRACVTCRITRPLREFDERLGVTAADFIGKTRSDNPRPASGEEMSHRLRRVIRNVLQQTTKHPAAPETADAIRGLLQALSLESRASVPAEAMTDTQLQDEIGRQLRSELRPLLLEIQAEFALLGLNATTNETEAG